MTNKSDDLRTLRLGAAAITVVNVGFLRADFAQWLDRPPERWPARYADDVTRPSSVPVNSILIALGDTSILVDPSTYDIPPDSPFALPGYQPPPGLLDRLAALSVAPSAISAVVLTHSHFDHISGTTIVQEGHVEPAFPNARYYLGRGDWERDDVQAALGDPASTVSRTLGVLQHRGLLELVEGSKELAPGVRLIAAPGETPGHQVVRVHADGHTLYCVGDLYHHPIEAEQPEWMVNWADPVAMRASQAALAEAALQEQALLVATHIPLPGRLHRAGAGVIWEAIE